VRRRNPPSQVDLLESSRSSKCDSRRDAITACAFGSARDYPPPTPSRINSEPRSNDSVVAAMTASIVGVATTRPRRGSWLQTKRRAKTEAFCENVGLCTCATAEPETGYRPPTFNRHVLLRGCGRERLPGESAMCIGEAVAHDPTHD